MKPLLIFCILGLLVLAACTEQEMHDALCSDRSKMSWKEKLFCLVYAPDAKNPGSTQMDKNALYYGCDTPPHSEADCVTLAIENYKTQNLCPSSTAHFEKVKCSLKEYSGGGNHWDCYIRAQCTT